MNYFYLTELPSDLGNLDGNQIFEKPRGARKIAIGHRKIKSTVGATRGLLH